MPNAFGTAKYSFLRPTGTTQYGASDLVANALSPTAITPMRFSLQRFVGKTRINAATLYTSTTVVTVASFLLNLFNQDPASTIFDNDVYAQASVRNQIATLAMDLSTGAIVGTNDKKKRIAFTTPLIVDLEQVSPSARAIFGLLQTQGAYQPAASERFEVELECEGWSR